MDTTTVAVTDNFTDVTETAHNLKKNKGLLLGSM